MGTDCLRARRATRVAATLAIALAGAASIGSHAAAAEVTPALSGRAADAAPGEAIPVIAELRRQVDAEAFAGRPEALGRALRRTSARSRNDVSDAVGRPLRRFWLVNAVAGRLTPAEVGALAADPDVARVDWDRPVRLAQAGGGAGTAEENWGVVAIGASRVWSEMSLRGEGVVVGSIDTGVSASHPEVAGKVLAFRDFVSGRPDPYDDNGHGTHTLGTMIGAGAAGGPIGVAPGARALVAKALGADGLGTGSQLLAAAQWMADPDGNPATQDQPAVVNNSWSASTANDPWFRKMIARWRELGIVPVFAAGNGGAAGLASPGGYPEVLATGAADESGAVPDFHGARRCGGWRGRGRAPPPGCRRSVATAAR